MTNSEKVAELVEAFKSCTQAEVKERLNPFLHFFPLISNTEKTRVANELMDWTKANAATQPYKLAFGYYLLCFQCYFTEEYEKCLSLSNAAQHLFDEQKDADGIALCLLVSGGAYRTMGNIDLALKALWESYNQLEKSSAYPHGTLATAFNIAGIYSERKNYEEAKALFEKTLEYSEQVHNPIFVFNSLQGLGKIYLVRKQYDAAKAAFERALAEAERVNSPIFAANILTDLANYYAETGNNEKAIEIQMRALDMRTAQNAIGGSITNIISLAGIYKAQNKGEDAVAILNKGLELAEQIKVKPKIYQLHQALSEVYEQMHMPDKSLHHYKLFHEIREQVEVEDEAKKIKNAQMIFEAELTKKENIIIKRQKEEIEHKNIELQETIDELTITKVSRRAKALTLVIAIILFIGEDLLLDFVLHKLPEDNIMLSLGAKILVVFSLKPIERGVEHYLLKKAIKKRKKVVIS